MDQEETDRLNKQFEDRMAKRKAKEEAEAEQQAEKDRQAYLRRTGRIPE